MMDLNEFLRNISVKIIKNTAVVGSGFLYVKESHYFVITCNHVLKEAKIRDENDLNQLCFKTDLIDSITLGDSKKYEGETDIVAISVILPSESNIPEFKLWNNECINSTGLNFKGWPNCIGDEAAIFNEYAIKYEDKCNNDSTFSFNIQKDIQNGEDYAITQVKGLSGSGIFHKGEEYYSCLGVFKGLFDEKGSLNRGIGVSVCSLPKEVHGQNFSELSYVKQFRPDYEFCRHFVERELAKAGKRFYTYKEEKYKRLNTITDTKRFIEKIRYIDDIDIQKWIDSALGTAKFHLSDIKQHEKVFKSALGDKKTSSIPGFDEQSRIKLKSFLGYSNNLKKLIEILNEEPLRKVFSKKNIQYPIIELHKYLNESKKFISDLDKILFMTHKKESKRRVPKELKFIEIISQSDSLNRVVKELKGFLEGTNNKLFSKVFKQCLIVGGALSGKTHVLCDIALDRIQKDKSPTLLFFGHEFKSGEDPEIQMIKHLGIENLGLNSETFLGRLNKWGENKNEFVCIIVDAINETSKFEFWKDTFEPFLNRIKKYPYISLVSSIRDLEVDKVFKEGGQGKLEEMIPILTHNGFKGVLGDVLPKFLQFFNIDEIKIKIPEEVTRFLEKPGLLFIFCEALYKANVKNIEQRHLSSDFVMNEYLFGLTTDFKNKYELNDRAHYYSQASRVICNEISNRLFSDYFTYDRVFVPIKQIHKSLLEDMIDVEFLQMQLDSDDNNYEVLLKFLYQWVGNYLVARFIVEGIEYQHIDFEESLFINKEFNYLLKNFEKYEALIEALVIQIDRKKSPDWGFVIEELKCPETFSSFLDSAFKRAGIAPKYIEMKFEKLKSIDAHGFNTFLGLGLESDYHLSFRNKQHVVLLSEPLCVRDSWWNQLVHSEYTGSFGEDNITVSSYSSEIRKLLGKIHKGSINDSNVRLENGLFLGWLLASTNREVRDKSTRALIEIYLNEISEFKILILKFEECDDLYVLERLWCVAYGVVIRSCFELSDDLIQFCEFAYEAVFNKSKVIQHVLLLDYARGIIEYAKSLGFDSTLFTKPIKPPFDSEFSFDKISDDISEYFGHNEIFNSMQVEYGRNGDNFTYGDFGRYVFQLNVEKFIVGEEIHTCDLRNFALKLILDLGYDKEKHIEFTRNVPYEGRSTPKVERIGKKYQWISMHQLLAELSNKHELVHKWSNSHPQKYEGPWQLFVRDIDPTLPNSQYSSDSGFKNSIVTWWQVHSVNSKIKSESEKIKWIMTTEDLPDWKDILSPTACAEGIEWFNLRSSYNWSEPRNEQEYRELWYRIHGIFVEKKNLKSIEKEFRNEDFRDYHDFILNFDHSYFIGEYCWHPMFKEISLDFDIKKRNNATYRNSCVEFYQEGESLDCSMTEKIQNYLPSPFLMDKLELRLASDEFAYCTSKEKIFFDPSMNEKGPSASLIKKENLLQVLENLDMTIAWVITGEKNFYRKEIEKKWNGRQVVGGFFYWVDNEVQGDSWSIEE